MQWHQLYTANRLSSNLSQVSTPNKLRTSFQKDYDRIIFSSAFRRMQNKTQVFPLPGPVFVHNRLTHSLEVASVGRSLGKEIGLRIAEKYQHNDKAFQEFYKYELATVIASACLAHDIGNPPFGHSGEDAIRAYFLDVSGEIRQIIHENLSINERLDFERFEGNSNAFRILTHNFGEQQSSFNLTLTTLAAIVKYPSSSEAGFSKSTGLISTKKSGYFNPEIKTFARIAEAFALPKTSSSVYARHPFVFLTEAADDICYRIIDMEDAHRLGIISFQSILDLFMPFFKIVDGYMPYAEVEKKLHSFNDPNQKVQFLRAVWIGIMTQQLSAVFMQNEDLILQGNFQVSLMDALSEPLKKLIDEINAFSYQYIYNHKPVVTTELAGYNVIGALLDEFVHAVIYPHRTKSQKILQLISQQFPIQITKENPSHNLYSNLLSVVDCISGMTDLYAMDLYSRLKGIKA